MDDKTIIRELNIANQALAKTLVDMCEGDKMKIARLKDTARLNHEWFEKNPGGLLSAAEVLSRKLG